MKNFQNAGRDSVESDESSDASAPADGPQRVGGTREGVGGPHKICWVVDSAWLGLLWLGVARRLYISSFFYVWWVVLHLSSSSCLTRRWRLSCRLNIKNVLLFVSGTYEHFIILRPGYLSRRLCIQRTVQLRWAPGSTSTFGRLDCKAVARCWCLKR